MIKYLVSLVGFSFCLMICSFSYQANIGLKNEQAEQFVWTQEDTSIYENPERVPEFVGGEQAMQKFLKSTVRYPEQAIMSGEQGKVWVEFVIEKDGSISNISIYESVSPSLDKESLRVVGLMPKWKPGVHNGEVVRTKMKVPIIYKLG